MRALCMVLVAAIAGGGCMASEEERDRAAPAPVSPSERAPLPEARTEVAGTTIDGKVLVIGGLLANGSASPRVDLYDSQADAWAEAPPLPVALHHVAAAEARGRAWVIGGYTNRDDGTWEESARVWSLGAGDEAWRPEPPLRAPRGAPAAAATDEGTIVVVGGTSAGRALASSEVLRPATGEWEEGPQMSDEREHLAATTMDGRVYAVAGRVGSLESNRRTVESWNPSDPRPVWRREPPLRHARGGTSAAGRCVAGGEQPEGTIGTVECFDDDGDRWTVVARLAHPRHGLAVALVGERLHVIGGGDRPGLFVSGIHEVLDVGAASHDRAGRGR